MPTIGRVFPPDRPAPGPGPVPAAETVVIHSTHSGFLTSFDGAALMQAAEAPGAVIRIDRTPGTSLVEGVPFATVWAVGHGAGLAPAAVEKLSAGVNAAIETGVERTKVQDVGFGFRQLVDVAVRPLSPGVNDPTTAVHVIGHLSVLLCRLTQRTMGPEHLSDKDGKVRVALALPVLGDLLDLAMNQPGQYGAADPAVAGRLLGLLHELSWCDRNGTHRAEVMEHLGRMRNAIGAANPSPAERNNLLDQADSIAALCAEKGI